jgi:hypothetical protein
LGVGDAGEGGGGDEGEGDEDAAQHKAILFNGWVGLPIQRALRKRRSGGYMGGFGNLGFDDGWGAA